MLALSNDGYFDDNGHKLRFEYIILVNRIYLKHSNAQQGTIIVFEDEYVLLIVKLMVVNLMSMVCISIKKVVP